MLLKTMKTAEVVRWTLLAIAAALSVCVGVCGAVALLEGGGEPSRRDIGVLLFLFYILMGIVAVLAVAGSIRRWNVDLLRFLRGATLTWGWLIGILLVLAWIFKWAV